MKRNGDNPELIHSEDWVCLNYTVSERACIFPLGYLSNHELYSLNVSVSMEITNMIPEFETILVALKSNNPASNDIEENLIDRINSKYYTINEFINNKSVKKYFNIFHSNVDCYECLSDGLREILSKSSLNFDVVCLSETSQQSDHVFPKNVTFENYNYKIKEERNCYLCERNLQC